MMTPPDVRAALARLPSPLAGKRTRSTFFWAVRVAIFLVAARYIILVASSKRALSDDFNTAAQQNVTIDEARAHALAGRARNATLGFGEIVYISLPTRSDRQDAMQLLASIHGLNVHLVPGVDGETVHPKSVPDGGSQLRPPELGCWRAHANAWRHMLASRQETMLILEDDADFDVNIHRIFERISMQMQHNSLRVVPPTEREIEAAPYGLDWDVMYLGQCSDYAGPRKDLAMAFDDPDAPQRAVTHEHFIAMMQSLGVYGKAIGKTRVVSPSYGPVCTLAYAITRRGAQRLLLNFSYLGLSTAVDVDMINKLQSGAIRGYTVTPPPFSSFRLNNEKDSDTIKPSTPEEGEKQKEVKEEKDIGNIAGTSLNIRNSARHAMLVNLDRQNWEDYEREMPRNKAANTAVAVTDETEAQVPQFSGTPEEGKEASRKAGQAPLDEVTDSSGEQAEKTDAAPSPSSVEQSADVPAAPDHQVEEKQADAEENQASTQATTESVASEETTPGEDSIEQTKGSQQDTVATIDDAPLAVST
ncbi:hypothetical protein V1525DRAFT_403052 [Lipomyces kononenkoae]|uniref:Uncharacterized protein n=1 Tax=Lipomyces kononenkoae TaxID=34357 RepID=A0ACC3T283_LIPKO